MPTPHYGPADVADEDATRRLRVVATAEDVVSDAARAMCEAWRADLSDAGMAAHLAEDEDHALRFVEAWDWMAWDGTRWRRDLKGARAAEQVREMTRGMLNVALDAKLESAVERELVRWIMKYRHARHTADVLTSARYALLTPAEAFDARPFLFNVANGTLDLETRKLRRHDRADLLTQQAPVTFDASATCPTWDRALYRIFDGDLEAQHYFQKWCGYCASGDTSEQAMLIPWGGGANGKTMVETVLRGVLGADYCKAAPMSAFTGKRTGPGDDLAKLCGARLVTVTESHEGARLNEPVIKNATGGDPLTVRFLFGQYFTYQPTWKISLTTNHRPVITGTDHAIWRRIHLLPFTVTIPPAERNPHLATEILATESAGVLNWITEGFQQWRTEGLNPPSKVTLATDDYRESLDQVGRFLADCTADDPTGTVPAGDLFAAYETWAQTSGEEAMSKNALSRRLTDRGYGLETRGTRGQRQRCRTGLTLRTEDGA